MLDDTENICKDGKFIGIAEMPIDILMSGIEAGSGMGRH